MRYANVTSTLALFVALGGVGYAATQLPKDSVGTRQLRDGSVTSAKLAAPVTSKVVLGSGTIHSGGACDISLCPPPGTAEPAKATFTLARAANVVVLSTTRFTNHGSHPATETISGYLDKGPSAPESDHVTLDAGAEGTARLQFSLGHLPAGKHTIRLHAYAEGYQGETVDYTEDMAVIALP